MGQSTYILDDGKTWHASHLAAIPDDPPESPDQPKSGPEESTEQRPNQQAQDPQTRVHRSPDWLKDYET